MINHKNLDDIDYDDLRCNPYEYNKEKNYQYIDIGKLDRDKKKLIIDIFSKNNGMPKNFLNFMYETNLDKLATIYKDQLKEDDNKHKSNYSASFNSINEYENHKFGIILKVNKEKKEEKQLVFYSSKDPELYEQFFLRETLYGGNYDFKHLQVEDTEIQKWRNQSKKSKTSSDNNQAEKEENDFDEIKKICDFIKGNNFESGVNDYLRRKIINANEDNRELPSVFYTINENKNYKIFYNEIDSIFIIEDGVSFYENILKINCKYENKEFENSKTENPNFLKIEGKCLLFVECKISGDFCGVIESLFKKIYRFRSLLDDIFHTKGYKTKILYLYDNQFINPNSSYRKFVSATENAITNCLRDGMTDVQNYDLFAFYICSNMYIYIIIQKLILK